MSTEQEPVKFDQPTSPTFVTGIQDPADEPENQEWIKDKLTRLVDGIEQ